MENIKDFLETASINGLAHIASTRRNVRLFWVIVVVTGFIVSGVMIKESFQSWADSPVTTTIETLPITEITFPKVTVCPPKNTFTDLNHDLMMAEKITLNNQTRYEIERLAKELLYEDLFKEFKGNVSSINDLDRYYNWYHGYSGIHFPDTDLKYHHKTYATSGCISTKYFGEKFNAVKVKADLNIIVDIHVPESIRYNENVTLNLEIENILLKNLSSGEDSFTVANIYWINDHQTEILEAFSPPIDACATMYGCFDSRNVALLRKVSSDDVRKMKLNVMPGFRVKWYYSSKDQTKIEAEAKYRYDNSDFARKCFILLYT